ncbi:MAG: acyltransferase family protein [Actinobacteria bacterium]|nr:acyltransferase family protein [Actinomycetota bacterium]
MKSNSATAESAPGTLRIPEIASDRRIGVLVKSIDQLARVTRPKFYGIERAGGEPALFVGNHTVYGVIDVPFMIAELWKTHGLAIRSLGDHRHWSVPLWREFLEAFGAVRGTREITAELMRRGEPILVFPGGAREVNKRRGEQYRLIWKNRTGFARLAIEHGYPVVPFAAVGGEEVYKVLIDANNPVYGGASKLVERITGDWSLPSIARGLGPTLLPRPQRLYFWFGEPIDSAVYAGRGEAGIRGLRDEVKLAVEGGIEFLLAEREADPGRDLIPRLLGRSA